MNDNRKINVLFVDGSVGFGGAGKSLSLLLNNMSENINKIVVTSQLDSIITKYYQKFETFKFRWIFDRLTIHKLISRLDHFFKYLLIRRITMKMVSLLVKLEQVFSVAHIMSIAKKKKADIIHGNSGFTWEAITAARLLGLPCVIHMRGFPSGSAWERKCSPFIAHFIAVSHAVAYALRCNGLCGANVTTVYDPVIPDYSGVDRLCVRERLSLGENEIAIGNFGRIVPWKGQAEFVEAMFKVLEQRDGVKVFLVGDESDASSNYFDDIKKRVTASKFIDNFVFTGYIGNVEMYYAAMDIVVHSAIEPEPFGMVVIEAMAAGKPVVAANAGGPREIITHGWDGLLVEPGDIESISQAVLALCNDPGQRAVLAQNAKHTTNSHFTIAKHVNDVEAVYHSLLAAH